MTESVAVEQRRLLPSILDYRAEIQPDRVWARFPVSPTSYDHGFRAATYSQMRNAVNRTAWIFAGSIGTSTNFDTLAYLGHADLRYHIVLLAAIKIGYKAFLPSPRNSVVAQKDLLSRLDCRALVTTDPEPPFVASILREYTVETVHIPSLDALLLSENVPYPYEKTFEEARNDPVFVLHTSGSTGIPKPMVYTNDFVWRVYKANTLPAPEGMTRIDDYFLRGDFLSFLPAFHIAGIGWGLVLPMFTNSVPVLPLPGRPPSTDGFLEALKYGSFDWAFLLPIIINELSTCSEALDLVATKLQYIFYTGGALPQRSGEIVSSKVPMFSGLGSSECSALPQLRISDPSFNETWRYIHFHPAAGPQFRDHMDDLYELVIIKSAESSESQPVFAMFPDTNNYETRDLFSPHPTIPNLWAHRGRRDDIVVFLNGEKTNPISFEEHISRHPAVRAALVVGNQRFEACLLVELATTEALSDKAKLELIETIWPTVEEANHQAPAHARISKSKILVLDQEKRMLRAGKGTVQREGTVRLYAEQIDALYSETDSQPASDGKTIIKTISSREDAVTALRTLVGDITSWAQFDDDADLFTLGMDSLQTLRLSGAIRSKLEISTVSAAVIYRNPSVNLLAEQVFPGQAPQKAKYGTTSTMTNLQTQYEQQIDQLASTMPLGAVQRYLPSSEVVVLTGSTGTVGSFILDQLLANDEVSHVYCLNRTQNSESLQTTRNQQRGLSHKFPPDRITFLTVDLTKDCFGLDTTTYTTLLERTTQIIHSAWPVDFNQPLQFFQPVLGGLLRLIFFAHQSQLSPSLLFLSSISAVSSYNQISDAAPLVPEEIVSNPACTAAMGYGESKYIAESILHYASTKLRIRCGVSRIGQVSGTATSPRGWNRNEWLPSLVISSRYLKAIPGLLEDSLLDVIDWVPVDELAPILIELSSSLASTFGTGGIEIFHCVNPRPVAWTNLLPVIIQELSNGEPNVTVVEFHEWLKILKGTLTQSLDSDIQQNPAVMLVDFYEQLLIQNEGSTARLSINKTAHVSKSLNKLQPIQPDWMRGWIREWIN
ncbi:hypothetical protein BDV06DRAFT_233299 [Aspergillus oleicola]